MAAVVVAGCSGGDDEAAQTTTGKAPAGSPNIIVVMTDDQTTSTFTEEAMPITTGLFEEEGAVFESAVATPPLCCPARSSFLTGQYPHNNGVLSNTPGYPDLREKETVLPTWLQAGGYETGFIGKYLNGYELVSQEPAPGWDSWFAAASYPAYFNYQVRDGEDELSFGSDPGDYSTEVFTSEALRFVEDSSAGSKPFFLWLAYNAPHIVAAGGEGPCEGEEPRPADGAAYEPFAEAELPSPPSFDEADRSDKPDWLSSKSPLDESDLEVMTSRWRCSLASLASVDDGIGRIVDALRESGELENTVLVFLSDNGFFFGEHGLDDDKRLAYGASSGVPMAISHPGVTGGETIERPVGTVDLAPTILDIAGARPCNGADECRKPDGRSILPLLKGAKDWPQDRGLLIELDDGYTYEAIRTQRYLYIELSADRTTPLERPAHELYDLREDPYELENLLTTDPRGSAPVADRLARRLDELRDCAGRTCQ